MGLRFCGDSVFGRHISPITFRESPQSAFERNRAGRRSRRNFLTTAAGAAGLAFWLPEPAARRLGRGKSADPKPIPGGVSPLGIFIHHFPAQLTAAPLDTLSEPSQITDFKGFVGLTRLRGAGTSPQYPGTLAYQSDMGFMKGQFIAEDGKLHQGVFGFI
jgi:hypothetical protein